MGDNRPYWIVACSSAEQSADQIYSVLQSRVIETGLCSDSAKFNVPLNLKYGSFDNLVRLVDDLAKHDSQMEGILRRIERQSFDLNGEANLKITLPSRQTVSVEGYVRGFKWDSHKYPVSRSLKDNIQFLFQAVTTIDDELKGSMAALAEIKASHSAVAKKEGGSFVNRDLTDVLTPQVISASDFIDTEHLATLVVCVPNGMASKWNESYESFTENVVPRSSRFFNVTDKEQNQLCRIVLFRSSVVAFKEAVKATRFTAREFTYSLDAYNAKVAERTRLVTEKGKREKTLTDLCARAFSDAFIGWVHLKAVRTFVEAVLRFGVPPQFSAYIVKPVSSSKHQKLRKELDSLFTTKGMFGRTFVEGARTTSEGADGDGEEEYYPYVSLEMNLTANRS